MHPYPHPHSLKTPSSMPLFMPAPTPIIHPPRINHKNPLLMLPFLVILLFRFGTSIPFSSTPVPAPITLPFDSPLRWPIPPPLAKLHTLSLRPNPAFPFDNPIPMPLSPSTSRSSLNALAASSFAALSALLAARPASLSETCKSSIVLSSFSILSLPRAISS
jgi:hypothetical protein